jgi:acyl-CoA reductase-like NAD-dependent aldehyde dehydrogenase
LADASDVDAAVAAARVAAPAWRAMTGHKRRDLFFKLAALCEANMAQLSALVTAEKGSICMAAPFMAIDAAQKFRYFGGWADKIQGRTINTWGGPAHDYIAQEPYGVVGAIIPWNGPLFAVTMVIAQALAAGSTLVIKSPETAPWSLIRASTKFSLSVVVQPRRRF